MSRLERHRGFTLVELLVVIGIIALLIGILLPALSRARLAALKTQDLSNCRQIVTAAVAYCASNQGYYPFATRGGGNPDDLAWMNSWTYDYFLQFCNNHRVTATTAANTTRILDNSLLKVMSCNAAMGSLPPGAAFTTAYYSSSGTSLGEMQMGWVYWGGRKYYEWIGQTAAVPYPVMAAPTPGVLNPADTTSSNGTLTGQTYTMPVRQGQHATTRTLVTCYSYCTPGYSFWIPHRGHGTAYGMIAIKPAPGNVFSQVKQADGLCMGYTDGSARFVSASDFGAIRWPTNASGSAMYIYDAKAQ